MCQVSPEKCYNRVVSYFTESPFKCHNSANIYGMNRIVRIMPTYLNMRYNYGTNLIAAKGFVSNESESDLCQCIIYLSLISRVWSLKNCVINGINRIVHRSSCDDGTYFNSVGKLDTIFGIKRLFFSFLQYFPPVVSEAPPVKV